MVLVARLVHLIYFLDLIEMDNDQVINLDDRIVDDLRNCLICQKSDVKDLNISLKLVANLGKFRDEKVLDETINEKVLGALHAGELKTKLTATNYNIHKKGYDNYNSTKLKQKIAAKNKKAATPSTCNTRNSHEPVKRFALECMYCEKPDTDSAKHPNKANQLHAAAANKTDLKYVKEFTETISATAAQLGDTKLLNKLSNDVRSSELYYHNNGHAEYKRKYNNKTFNKVENSNITYNEFSVLISIKNYIDDSEDDSFDLKYLEKLYIDRLAEIGKSIDSYITRFAAKIVNTGLTVA